MSLTQVYDPLNSPLLSAALAALPIVLLLGLLATGRVTAHVAALAGLVAAVVLAIVAYTPAMPEVSGYGERVLTWTPTVLAATGMGAAYGLLPIGWIVVAAIFLYSLTVDTGQFATRKKRDAARITASRFELRPAFFPTR